MSDLFLKERVDFLYGFSVRIKNEIQGNYPVMGSNGVTGYINTYKIEAPGVIIGRKGTVGAVNLSKTNFTPTDTAYYLSIKDQSKDDIIFWYYYLKVLGLNKLNTHSSVPGLSREVAYLIKVNPPNLKEQKKIAHVLSVIDEKIEIGDRINQELEKLAKTIYDYWFVQFDFPDENGKPYKSSGGEMVYNAELKRKIPKGWEVGTLFDLGDIVGGSTPSTKNLLNFSNNGIAWITPKDLSENVGNKFISKGNLDITETGLKEASLKIYPKESILLSSRAPIGYMAISRNNFTTNQGFKSFIPNKGFSPYFVYYTVQNSLKTIILYATGSTFKEISATTLKSIKLCLPRKKIVNLFTKKITSIFHKQDILEQENQKLKELRDWLLPMLMNGQVKVK